MMNFLLFQMLLNKMSKISELSLTKIVNGIKKKDFTSEEVTNSFINNSKKSKQLNTYITECFDDALKAAKNFDKKKNFKGSCARQSFVPHSDR